MYSKDFTFEAPQKLPGVSDLSHTYDSNYPRHQIDVGDDDEENWSPQRVADKAYAVAGYGQPNVPATFGENSILYNENGDRLVLQAFYSMPMLPKNQYYRSDSRIDSTLYQRLSSVLSRSPTATKGAAGKIQFQNIQVRNAAISAISNTISTVVPRNNLALYKNTYPIYWINPENLSSPSALTVGISHWMFIPAANKNYPNTYGEIQSSNQYSNVIKHYFFGYVDSVGIPTTGGTDLIRKFNVGTIERMVQMYGVGTNALKRMSALKPSRVLGMNATGGYDGQFELKALDNTVTGKILRDPYNDLYRSIQTAYGSNPTKVRALTEVTEKIIGKNVGDPIRYPIKIDNINYTTSGFSTNALSVDYMEILHPLLMMKRDGVINNGIYNAAQAFLGEKGDGGRTTFNLAECAVAYPDAANAKLFDSMLINPRTGGRILISSKENQGAAPSAASLGSVYNMLKSHLDDLKQKQIDNPEFKSFVLQDTRAKAEFTELLAFFSALAGERGREDRITQLMPRDPYAKKLAEKMIARDPNIADLLNTWNGGNSYSTSGKGAFLRYCSTVMRFTPLVQANTVVEKTTQSKMDEPGSITIKGVMATWPNKIFDDIEFLFLNNVLRFKISIGSAEGMISQRQPNVRGADGAVTQQRAYKKEPNWDAWKGRDYSGKMAYRPRYTFRSYGTTKVPGYERTWNALMKSIEENYNEYLQGAYSKDEISSKLKPLYMYSMNFVRQNGHDPGMNTDSNMTRRELLNKVYELLK